MLEKALLRFRYTIGILNGRSTICHCRYQLVQRLCRTRCHEVIFNVTEHTNTASNYIFTQYLWAHAHGLTVQRTA